MCTKPIRIKNNNKYINTNTGKPYYLWVNCGHCSECIRAKQQEWNLRTYYMFEHHLLRGDWVYFDTLTYNNKNLPRLNRWAEYKENYPCFDYRDIRAFYEKVRQKNKQFEKLMKYFITSEYGGLRNRPHYHILWFLPKDIEPLQFSKDVAKAWGKGRTDGLPYKSRSYVMNHNIITNINMDAIRYVAKYVTKSVTFMEIVNKRWEKIEKLYEKINIDPLEIKRRKRKYYQLTTPFHRQSQHYGESAMDKFKIEDIIKGEPMYYKDDSLKVAINIAPPNYFIRKYFQEQVKVNGKRIWVYNDNGIQWKKTTETKNIESIKNRIEDLALMKGIKINAKELAEYIYKERGRFKGEDDYKPNFDRAEAFNYNTDKDLIYLGTKCISNNFAGNDKIGYCTTEIEPITEFIENEVYLDNEKEAILEALLSSEDTTNAEKLKEHINEIRKIFFQKY